MRSAKRRQITWDSHGLLLAPSFPANSISGPSSDLGDRLKPHRAGIEAKTPAL
jgi:hypothetical protein